MKILTAQERQAAEILLKSVNRVSSYTYKELGNMLTPPAHPRTVLPKIIGNVSYLCFELGVPLLSVKVVNQTTNKAGLGFYNLYCDLFPDGKNKDPNFVERNENKKIRLWDDWTPLLNYLDLQMTIPISPLKQKEKTSYLEKQIRILPMCKSLEFQNYNIEDIQQKYFLGDLIKKQKGFYYFREAGMYCASNSVILFQFDNQIVAYAVLKEIHKYNELYPDKYKGAFEFFIDSIKVFEPISFEDIRDVIPEIAHFSQVKQIINWERLDSIEKLISKKQMLLYPEELRMQEKQIFIEGAKKQVIVNAYERNPLARQECIKEHGYRCIICGFDFGEVYGEDFHAKIHVHHIKPLYLLQNEYELNPKTDLAPVCPNCHMVIHSKSDGVYSIDEVKQFIAKNNT